MSSMGDTQLEKQIQLEAEPYIPFDIKDVNLDWYIMGERPEREGTMDVVLVAAKKDYMAEYLDLISSLGLVPIVVDVDPFALEVMYEFSYPNVQEEVVALVNVGASTININILEIRCLPIHQRSPHWGRFNNKRNYAAVGCRFQLGRKHKARRAP